MYFFIFILFLKEINVKVAVYDMVCLQHYTMITHWNFGVVALNLYSCRSSMVQKSHHLPYLLHAPR